MIAASDVGEAIASKLVEAAKKGEFQTCVTLVHNKASVNSSSKGGTSALHWAAKKKHNDVLDFLIQQNANVESVDQNGQTCLASACRVGNAQAAVSIIAARANVNHQDKHGMAAIHWVAQHNDVRIITCLHLAGADIDLQGTHQLTPLSWAISSDHPSAVQWLLRHNADFTVKDSHNRTTLHWCAVNGMLEEAKAIMKRGGFECLNVLDTNNDTASALADKHGHSTLAKKLAKWEQQSRSIFTRPWVLGYWRWRKEGVPVFTGQQAYFFAVLISTILHHSSYILPLYSARTAYELVFGFESWYYALVLDLFFCQSNIFDRYSLFPFLSSLVSLLCSVL